MTKIYGYSDDVIELECDVEVRHGKSDASTGVAEGGRRRLKAIATEGGCL